jgi:hypothetical protein
MLKGIPLKTSNLIITQERKREKKELYLELLEILKLLMKLKNCTTMNVKYAE